jgi:hypothetical protein
VNSEQYSVDILKHKHNTGTQATSQPTARNINNNTTTTQQQQQQQQQHNRERSERGLTLSNKRKSRRPVIQAKKM